MLNTDSINYIELSLLECQVDLILDALQLYAFNFHRVWPVERNSDLEDLRNSLIFHTYDGIQAKYNKSKCDFTNYNLLDYNAKCVHKDYNIIDNCRLVSRRKRYKKYYSKKVA